MARRACCLLPVLSDLVIVTGLAAAQTGAAEPPPPSMVPASAAATLADAHDWFMQGAYGRAVSAYRTLIDQDPNQALEAHLGLARCRLQTGAYDEAITALAGLDARDSPEWHYLLAALFLQKGRYQDTLAQARAAIKLDTDHAAARLLLGRTLELLGRRESAVPVYRWFDRQLVERAELPPDASWITHTALGFLRYSVLTRTNVPQRTQHVLHEMLQTVYERLDRTYWPARIAAADLLREKYNNDEQDGSLSDYEAALRINENLPQAHVGIGEVMLTDWKFEAVEQRVEAALRVNPRYAPALHLLGEKYLLERRYDQAISASDRALAINPSDVMALSIGAAARACQYDDPGVDRVRRRIEAINPRCALFHRTLGDALAGIRQYRASEREYLKAIELDPGDANARTELGMMYMQWGPEDRARDALEAAWTLDPFNERTKFTLELLERLERFTRFETPHVVVKFDAGRDPGLGALVARHLETIYDTVTGDYETAPTEKTIVEIFPTQRAFAVRITGKPWIHTIGASTGRVIALASPHDVAHHAPYNLARVLTHEFTHTVTLAATENRIPHWLTEGLAVYQEEAPRPFPWYVLLADAARRDRLFTLESIDWGFIRPQRRGDRQMAYAQSEWMCEYIVERFGYEAINAMLRRFRRGATQRQVFVKQLGLEPEAFHHDFCTWARKELIRRGFDLTPPQPVGALRIQAFVSDDAVTWGRLARAEFDAGRWEPALNAARRAIRLDAHEPEALKVHASILARNMHDELDDAARRALEDEVRPTLERLLSVDPDGWIAPKYLAEIALRRGRVDRAIELFQRLQRRCPMDPASWRGLGGIFLDRGDLSAALPQLLELARLEGDDAGVASTIAGIYRGRGRLREARHWLHAAAYIDPFSLDLHQELGDTAMRLGETASALREYRLLTNLDPGNARHFEDAAFAAHKLGDTAQARTLAREAVRLDPDSTARPLLP